MPLAFRETLIKAPVAACACVRVLDVNHDLPRGLVRYVSTEGAAKVAAEAAEKQAEVDRLRRIAEGLPEETPPEEDDHGEGGDGEFDTT